MPGSLCLLLVLLFTSSLSHAADAERLYADATDLPDKPSWVGQQVLFSVVVAMDDRPQGSPRFTLPDVSGGILMEFSDRPTFGTENKDGVEYTTWRYGFAFYL